MIFIQFLILGKNLTKLPFEFILDYQNFTGFEYYFQSTLYLMKYFHVIN